VEKTKVAIVGLGTVGSGVAKLLLDHGDRTARHAGRTLWLEKAVVRDLSKVRGCELPAGVLTENLADVLEDQSIEVVAQLIGGLEPARSIMLQLLEAGKNVVTANKALLAEHGPELFDRARSLGRCIAFEAAVAGGIPIITNVSQCLSANQVESIQGILNGTSNFIISKMDELGWSYADALAAAQQLGYAEADPTMDVDGSDAAQKLAILAHLAFGVRIRWDDIPKTGIDTLDIADLKFAKELGYRIKLIAHARLADGGLELSVAPTLIRIGEPLAEVRANYNAIKVVGDAVGDLFFHGQGAGQMPTASAVVADMIDVAVGRAALTFHTLELWSKRESSVSIMPIDDLPGRYYMRFQVKDEPGVMAQITSLLGAQKLSIASIIQHEPDRRTKVDTVKKADTVKEADTVQKVDTVNTNKPAAAENTAVAAAPVQLVIMTHEAPEGAAQVAVEKIMKLDCVSGAAVRMRVIEERRTR
jgi:homoserine dehydrogenase